jgi:hypothetical protein
LPLKDRIADLSHPFLQISTACTSGNEGGRAADPLSTSAGTGATGAVQFQAFPVITRAPFSVGLIEFALLGLYRFISPIEISLPRRRVYAPGLVAALLKTGARCTVRLNAPLEVGTLAALHGWRTARK